MVILGRFAKRYVVGRPLQSLLLHGVRQFMGQKMTAGLGCRIELAVIEDDVLAHGVGVGIHGARRFGSLGSGMNTDDGEIAAKSRLHEGTRGRIEGTAWRIQYPAYSGGRGGGGGRSTCRRTLDSLLLFIVSLVLFALPSVASLAFAAAATGATGALLLEQHRSSSRQRPHCRGVRGLDLWRGLCRCRHRVNAVGP